jgi:hypothetical protein
VGLCGDELGAVDGVEAVNILIKGGGRLRVRERERGERIEEREECSATFSFPNTTRRLSDVLH